MQGSVPDRKTETSLEFFFQTTYILTAAAAVAYSNEHTRKINIPAKSSHRLPNYNTTARFIRVYTAHWTPHKWQISIRHPATKMWKQMRCGILRTFVYMYRIRKEKYNNKTNRADLLHECHKNEFIARTIIMIVFQKRVVTRLYPYLCIYI